MSSTHPIIGVWLPVKAELDGVAAPEMVISRTELIVSGDSYKVYFAGEIHDRGHYRLSPAAGEESHEHITLVSTHGENDGRTLPSIFQLVGNRLRICYGLNGALPNAFSTAVDSQRYLVTYRRKN
ncbi:MAG TPA: TIGR03067 domain-containing protein [Rariglobus sp.]|nr:TIGR03067 domain-containing protein [Rariglobus sp.]